MSELSGASEARNLGMVQYGAHNGMAKIADDYGRSQAVFDSRSMLYNLFVVCMMRELRNNRCAFFQSRVQTENLIHRRCYTA